MSRIGNNPITLPEGVTFEINNNVVTVKGKLGELSQEITDDITVEANDGTIVLKRPSESKSHKAKHGQKWEFLYFRNIKIYIFIIF